MAKNRKSKSDDGPFLNRELSWIEFNFRVLEAGGRRRPAAAGTPEVRGDRGLERGREFFMVRSAGSRC
jgi:hypothetical protein